MIMLNPLRYIDEVARCGSIRTAADRLHVAPSAISRHIRNIEEDIGLLLFERHARGVVLTAAGVLFARSARSALLDHDRIRSEIEDVKGLRRGHIRIHTIDGLVGGPMECSVARSANAIR
jgi:DNA-binding transcriptional LysR family regulator